jgi:hypothetical protein
MSEFPDRELFGLAEKHRLNSITDAPTCTFSPTDHDDASALIQHAMAAYAQLSDRFLEERTALSAQIGQLRDALEKLTPHRW